MVKAEKWTEGEGEKEFLIAKFSPLQLHYMSILLACSRYNTDRKT